MGLSFPVSDKGFLFFNFGYFFQVPLFDYMYTGLNVDLKKGVRVLYGNPDLKPERTKAYDFSYKRTLVDTKTFLATDSKAEDDGFTPYVNLPAARSSGIEMTLEKRYGNYVSGKLSYT